MADHTAIEWTEATWNPITGCSVHSPGCTNCYAMKLAGTRLQHHWSRKGLTRDSKAGPVWTGEVRFNEEWLTQPLTWKRPRMIFVCAHGDLFHESVPDEWIDRVFAVMALAPQHTFQVLTKRSERMRDYIGAQVYGERSVGSEIRHLQRGGFNEYLDLIEQRKPLPNVWLGVSVEEQARADERVPDLIATPAAVRWLSCEPLLGPAQLTNIDCAKSSARGMYWVNALTGEHDDMCRPCAPVPKLDWVVVGGESGPDARPMHPDWARSLRDQCHAAGVPFFFKQWGEWEPRELWSGHLGGGRFETQTAIMPDGSRCPHDVTPQDVGAHRMARVGKNPAGRLLDGVEHSALPASPLQQGDLS